jgi:Domain of unknown function (DUF4157)
VSARATAGSGRRLLQRKCTCGHGVPDRGRCAACGRPDADHVEREAPRQVSDVLRAPGERLEPRVRAEMEARFAHDFANVRVHRDAASAGSARSLDADAYTVGPHVVFARGRYAPGTEPGKRLLAHELAHTMQQPSLAQAGPVVVSDDAALERDADVAAARGIAPALRAGPGVMRQSAAKKRPADHIYRYGRAEFDGRFNGEVDAQNNRVTLIVRLQLVDMGPEKGREGRIEAFAAKAVPIIRSAWSNKFALKSVCAADQFEADVRLVVTDSDPHHTVHVWPDASGQSSSSENWQASDLEIERRESPVLIDPKKPPTPDNVRMMTFEQIPAAHEFGHLIGLHHVACEGNAERCYGVTAEQKLDIMGYGMDVSPRDYAPFRKIMERYGADTQQPECNKWDLVTPG